MLHTFEYIHNKSSFKNKSYIGGACSVTIPVLERNSPNKIIKIQISMFLVLK